MLSDNIRVFRKKANLSQEELAEKIGVSRQSVSFWETGQTQPTIENIVALTKVLNVSSDELLDTTRSVNTLQEQSPDNTEKQKKRKVRPILVLCMVGALIVGMIIATAFQKNGHSEKEGSAGRLETPLASADSGKENLEKENAEKDNTIATEPFDLFSYCRDFAIAKGVLNGDYSIYQQPSVKYGGYENEFFSLSYWADSDMVEFCLHCPLSETQSHNFYLRMRGGFNREYEYASSKYYRDSGESFRFAYGFIDPAVFSDVYPINCEDYSGSADGQNEFMEESRVGICDLIYCLKEFVTVENMECDFSDFEFVNF